MYKVYEVTFVILLSSMLMLLVLGCVYKDNGKTYIVDITGERGDVTQAKSIGFNPYHFHFGMERNAFTPLDDSDLKALKQHKEVLESLHKLKFGDKHLHAHVGYDDIRQMMFDDNSRSK